MKRDARIGLAVVLVLGLSITLLVARSIHQNAAKAGIGDEPTPVPETAVASEPQTETAATIDPAYDAQAQAIMEFQTRHEYTPGPVTEVADAAPPAGMDNQATTGSATANSGPVQTASMQTSLNTLPQLGVPPIPPGMQTAVAADTPVSAGGLGSYTIAAGDNPWKISAKVFGDGKYAQKIVEANPGLNPAKLRVGQKIVIPVIADATSRVQLENASTASNVPSPGGTVPVHDFSTNPGPIAASSLASQTTIEPVANGGQTQVHKIQAGETLGIIAAKYLGSSGPKTVKKLLDANPGVDPRRLKIGQELKIPAP